MAANDSHLSQDHQGKFEKNPISQHKRAALGETVTGQTNPNGAETGPTENKTNQRKTW